MHPGCSRARPGCNPVRSRLQPYTEQARQMRELLQHAACWCPKPVAVSDATLGYRARAEVRVNRLISG